MIDVNASVMTSREAYQEILVVLSRLGDLADAQMAAEIDLRDVLRVRLAEVPGLVSTLYWDEGVKISLIAASLGVTLREARSLIGPNVIETACLCGSVFRVAARSHEHARNAIEGKYECEACRPRPSYGWPERLAGRRDLDRLARLREMPYQEYLQSREWAETREQALHRAGNACQVCSGKYRLQVHHRTYDRLGSEQPRDLFVLCAECHEVFHRNGRLRR